MVKLLMLSTFLVVAIGATVGWSSGRHEYVQTDCALDDKRLTIWMRDLSDREDNGRSQNIEFQNDGPLIRFWPQFYALDWSSIKSVAISYNGESHTSGKLSFVYANGGKRALGEIQATCWEKVKKYIGDKDRANNIPINAIEIEPR